MSKIENAFKNGKAFIPFITCGDPDLETTEQIIYAMERAGADIIELGIPFSDPMAEGPVIMEANKRALKNKVTTDHVFDMVARIRQKLSIPLVFMTYANLVYSYGIERFLKKCREVEIDGLILPDVPYEEKEEFESVCNQYGVDWISMVALTSQERIARIVKESRGFIYCVSSLGVTGVRQKIDGDIASMVAKVKEAKDIPCVIGFGISTPEMGARMADYADGIVVGSAIVKICAEYGRNCIVPIEYYVRQMKQAINSCG